MVTTIANPTLILLPGLHGTADLFHPLLALIPKTLPTRILTYPTARCRSYAHHYRRIETELADQTNLILFAESFSGPLALKFAASHPTRVRALILCGTFITSPVPFIFSLLAPIPILLHLPIPTLALRTFLAGHDASKSLIQESRRAIRQNHAHVLAHRVLQTITLDARKDLKNCQVPILCLAGTRDRLLGRRSTRRIRRLRPDIPIHSFRAPHLLLQTRPAEIWQAINEFLRPHWNRKMGLSNSE